MADGGNVGTKPRVIHAPKCVPDRASAKTAVDRPIPLTITSKEDEYTVVLTAAGILPAAYPILIFDLTGPAGWFYDVQIVRGDHTFFPGAGITGAWTLMQSATQRVQAMAFSSWTFGLKTLKLDGPAGGVGRATFTMPLEWWKDQARQSPDDFDEVQYFYRALAFKDDSGAAPRYSTPYPEVPPSVTLKNNLTLFEQTVFTEDETPTVTGAGAHATIKTANRISVREPNTWDMYCMVQWVMGEIRVKDDDGNIGYGNISFYGFMTKADNPDWTIDRYQSHDPRYRDNVPDAHDQTSATFTDAPGFTAIGSSVDAEIYRMDFKGIVHLNCDVMGKAVSITFDGALPVFNRVMGVLPDPQPVELKRLEWKVRILVYRHKDHLEILHPKDNLNDPVVIDPLKIES